MGPFGLSEEQLDFARAVSTFAARECGTREQRDKLTDHGAEQHNTAIYEKLAATGLLGVSIPEEYGGSGGGIVEQAILFEELWRGMVPVHGAGTSHTVAGVYKRFASEDQKHAVLGEICAGDAMSISISEPGAGSDVAAVSCKAELDGDVYRITGQKTWCSDAQFATKILLLARTERSERPHAGLTLFEIPANSPGLEVRPIDTMGGREVNDLFFSDVAVPASAVVGEGGAAWKQVMAGLNDERIVCAAQGLGTARRVLADVLAYVKERQQFGAPIGSYQALRHRIADMAIEIEAARALTYDTTHRVAHDIGTAEELVRATSMTKVKVTETAKRVALEGVQMMGAYGYATEFDMERLLRLSIAPTIYAGTNEIQRDIISGTYGLRASRR